MLKKSDFRGERSSRERDFKQRSAANLPWKGFLPIYVDTGYSILTDMKNTEMEQRWSESAGKISFSQYGNVRKKKYIDDNSTII